MSELSDLVARLPDTYQKIYGAPEFDGRAFRDCEPRWRLIEGLLSAWGRGEIRVLDAGCAQGYFSLKAAERGCRVTGIDVSEPNIALCSHLARRSGLDASFENRALDEEFLAGLPDRHFDIVFLFSVAHHIYHERGPEAAGRLMALLARKARCVIAELALRSEPLYWAGSLPEDPETVLAAFPFRKRLAEWPTHLSEVRRPVYFASGNVCLVDGRFFAFEAVQERAHDFVGDLHRGTRRYFIGDGLMVKEYRLDAGPAAANRAEAERERELLSSHGGSAAMFPPLLAYEDDGRHVRVARGLRPGTLLSSFISKGAPYDARRVILDVLNELVELERRGLYHSDLRTWNVVLAPGGKAGIIDPGAVSRTRPADLLDAFLTFCWCVCKSTQPPSPEVLSTRRSADWFDGPWRLKVLRASVEPDEQVSFSRLREIFEIEEAGMPDETALQVRANAENIRRLEERLNRLYQAFPPDQTTARDFERTLALWSERLERIDRRLEAGFPMTLLRALKRLHSALFGGS